MNQKYDIKLTQKEINKTTITAHIQTNLLIFKLAQNGFFVAYTTDEF